MSVRSLHESGDCWDWCPACAAEDELEAGLRNDDENEDDE